MAFRPLLFGFVVDVVVCIFTLIFKLLLLRLHLCLEIANLDLVVRFDLLAFCEIFQLGQISNYDVIVHRKDIRSRAIVVHILRHHDVIFRE